MCRPISSRCRTCAKFLQRDGVIASNHQTSPLAQQAPDTLTILTGLFGDRMGVPIGDSSAAFRGDGSVGIASALAYWTATGSDGKPLMLADTGKMAPAPWVPFTRAGCDVGAFAVTGLTLQQLGPDVATALGASEARAAAGNPEQARASLLGIAIHCARGSLLCGNVHARPDLAARRAWRLRRLRSAVRRPPCAAGDLTQRAR